jgi:hypothetical protein
MIGRKEKAVLHLLSLVWGSLMVLKMVPIKTSWQKTGLEGPALLNMFNVESG